MEDTTKDPVENNQSKNDNVTKVRLSPQGNDDNVTKVDLNNPVGNETEENNVDPSGVEASAENADASQEQEEVQQKEETQEESSSVIEEITNEDDSSETEETEETAEEKEVVKELDSTDLPESIQKLMSFMEETGGSLEDYVGLNRSLEGLEDNAILREYYKKTKPHLDSSDIDYLIEEKYSYDEDIDDESEIRGKKIALKEQVAEAKAYLDGQKSKYYEEIKAGSKLTTEQQKAIDFFNRYNQESEANTKRVNSEKLAFNKKTENVFNDKFKGFEYNVGEKRYRFNVKNAREVKEAQSDINNFIKKFLNKDGIMEDAKGYHKSLYTAMNADAVAQHFYEQGRADALKDSIDSSKNIDMDPRGTQQAGQNSGIKVRVVGETSSELKVKIKNKR